MLKDKTVVLGICGGIAAYKAVEIASRLTKLGARVRTVMTDNAINFVQPLTFQTITRQPVEVDMFAPPQAWDARHISLSEAASVIVVAPATYNVIGKIAHGIADDLLTTTIAAARVPVILAPAMNSNMYNNPICQNNLKLLQEAGYSVVEPETGRMACGTVGAGRLPEPEVLVEEVIRSLSRQDLAGMRILITAGPTYEKIDPVRFLVNPSSGKMGYSIALAALRRGAMVTLVSGPVNCEPPRGLRGLVRVESTQQMLKEVIKRCKDQDVIIKAAAPMDFRPLETFKQKIKKSNQELTIKLATNVDILEQISRKKGDRILVGFAAETENIVQNAREKLTKKNLDFIVANDITQPGAGFKADTNKAVLVFPDQEEELPQMEKVDLAHRILDEVLKLRREIK